MRRLVQHAALGLGCAALAFGAAFTGVGSPAGTKTVVAVPATVTDTTETSPGAPVEQAGPDRRAERERLVLTAAVEQATKRTAALTSESRSIDRQQAKIAAATKAATAKKARAAKAKKARIAEAKAEAARAKAAEEAAAEAAEAARARAAAEVEAAEKARAKRVKAQGYEAGTSDPREMAKQILQNKFGYGADQFSCFNDIIIRESNWDIDATNPSSGAYGIPQALPGSKMATVADDWRTNPATQIIWAVGYMKDRYGSPCSAWTFKRANGWY